MSDKSAIEWTDATWNPTTGCSKVSPGCANCYAETLSLRFGRSMKPWTPANAVENVTIHPARFDMPLKWREPKRIFVDSMSDLFHELVPDHVIASVWQTMAKAPRHQFQILTKRPERMPEIVERRVEEHGKVRPLRSPPISAKPLRRQMAVARKACAHVRGCSNRFSRRAKLQGALGDGRCRPPVGI